MAIRIQNSARLDYGIIVPGVTATHIRLQRTAETDDEILIDAQDIAAAAGERLVVEIGGIDLIVPEGTTGWSRHLNRSQQDDYFANVSWNVDLLKAADTVINEQGYAGTQTHSAWTITEVADP